MGNLDWILTWIVFLIGCGCNSVAFEFPSEWSGLLSTFGIILICYSILWRDKIGYGDV